MCFAKTLVAKKKQQLIRKISEAVTSVLNKDPHLTHIVINEIEDDNWGYAGDQVSALKEQGFSTEKNKR